jgi:metallo-beta-lactamase family protein
MLRCTFYGAVRTVTGSMHLVETGGARLLLDCGLFQGPRAQAAEINSRFPFPPSSIDAVVLSHAHLDHCGNLPTLVTAGFRGPIYCTPATQDLAALVMHDSAKIQHQDAHSVNKVRLLQKQPPVQPLYTSADVDRAIGRLKAVGYGAPVEVGGARITFANAGHILGSAVTVVEAAGRVLGFTGDLGRSSAPLLRPPATPPALDVLITESTYGDRNHESYEAAIPRMVEAVRETVARGGTVMVPAFAIGRTQDITYALSHLAAGQTPVPTFVDSPMAVSATQIYRRHPDSLNDAIRAELERHQDPFGSTAIHYIRDIEESKALNSRTDPFIVIATSGMCESGRILYHLGRHIGDPRASLLIVSFQAANTLGRRLADGVSPVHILGETYDVRFEVRVLPAFSAHADGSELLAWIQKIPRVGHVYCVHGEEGQSLSLAQRLAAAGYAADVPTRGQTVDV